MPTRKIVAGSAPVAEDPVSGLIEEMVRRQEAGEPLGAEELLAREPKVAEDPDAALRLIYEEFCLRQEKGEPVSVQQFLERFPRWRPQLEALLDCHRLLLPVPTPVDQVARQAAVEGRFHIEAELGRGANGPVFLATESALANRPVVLKVIPLDGREHLTLARLQHTHIVPLYAVIDHPAELRRILCMPYLGGATLAQLIDALKETPVEDRTGQQLLTALDQIQARFLPLPIHGPARKALRHSSWTEAVCWIGACLADALYYAHERGLVHLDVKPSNILLTSDGQPMMLDFHIAQQPIRPEGRFPDWLGGTPGYSSPEQNAALTALTLGAPIPQAVDGRSDIYSLGLVLYRLLGGMVPSGHSASAAPALDRLNPRVSPGLSDIVSRCLAEAPAERYPTAQALAEDLRRHLTYRPLRGVRNRSLRERWQKWHRRDPRAMSVMIMALAVLATALAFSLFVWHKFTDDWHKAQTNLEQGKAYLQASRYDLARDQFSRGLELCRSLPGSGPLADLLNKDLQAAQRAHEVEQFHQLVDRLRFLCGSSEHRKRTSPNLERRWREVWQRRHDLLDSSQARLTPEVEEQLRLDLLDLGIIWADLRLRGPGGKDPGIAETERLLGETEELFGESQVLCRLRQACAEVRGHPKEADQFARRAEELTPRTAWEHYALGRWLLGQGQDSLPEAAAAFERSIDLPSAGFWPWFYLGTCSHQREKYEDALRAFRVCITLAPRSGPSYYNRALAQEALARLNPKEQASWEERALRNYTRALELDPDLADAALNRGSLHLRAGRLTEAAADLNRALEHGASQDQVYYNLALVQLKQKDLAGARASVRRALNANPDHPQAKELFRHLEQ
jgi:serine/threonine protein kinase/Tfp pilus assembly protein PilF